jgi:PleD family two-component response regulator
MKKMSKSRILVVEDDLDIVHMLRIYFESQGFAVTAATKGQEALTVCHRQVPNVIILDINLPDIDGYEVCRTLRNSLRTSHIPIIFLTQKDQRSDRIAGLELGADDYVTKPFDIEELKLRVQNALRRASYENLTNPITGLPSGKLIEEHLRGLLQREHWGLLYVGISNLRGFSDSYGFVAADDLIRFTGIILGDAVDAYGTPEDFIGHVGGSDFIVISTPDKAEALTREMVSRFNKEGGAFYAFRDRERGYIVLNEDGGERHVPLATLSVGVITDQTSPFADIREITEVAAEARRNATTRT